MDIYRSIDGVVGRNLRDMGTSVILLACLASLKLECDKAVDLPIVCWDGLGWNWVQV